MHYRFGILAVGAGLAALGTLAAGPAQAQDRERVWERVKLDDLNFSTEAGHRTARERIEDAARRACGPDRGREALSRRGDGERCMAEVRASGQRRVAVLQAEQRAAEDRRVAAERAAMQRATPRVATRNVGTRYRHCTWPKRYQYKKRVCVWRYRR